MTYSPARLPAEESQALLRAVLSSRAVLPLLTRCRVRVLYSRAPVRAGPPCRPEPSPAAVREPSAPFIAAAGAGYRPDPRLAAATAGQRGRPYVTRPDGMSSGPHASLSRGRKVSARAAAGVLAVGRASAVELARCSVAVGR